MRDLKKIFLTAGAVAAVGVTASVGTFAGFTDQKSIANNSFSAGKVEVTLEGKATGGSVLQLSDMVFGDITSGDLKVTNTGRNRSGYVLDATAFGALIDDAADANDLSNQLMITITDKTDGGTVVARKSVAGFVGDPAVSLGDVLNRGESRVYTVTAQLDTTGSETKDNLLATDNGSLTFDVKATQRDGKPRTNDDDAATGDTPLDN
jgi:predicted ribosomally synthesized peptide with SipW-like signal peptide